MGLFRRRDIPGNARVVTSLVYDPDPFSIQAASLGLMTNTYSHGSTGAGDNFTGDRGYGVNRWAGRAPYAVQTFTSAAVGAAVAPVAVPKAQRLGAGTGVAGQPGLPSTGGTYGLDFLTGLGG